MAPKTDPRSTKCAYRLPDFFESGESYHCNFDRALDERKYCVFHCLKQGNEGYVAGSLKVALSIENEFRERLETDVIIAAETDESAFIDFRGFNFPKEFSFPERTLKKESRFSYAVFLGDVSFTVLVADVEEEDLDTEYRFLSPEGADFFSATFNGTAFFENALMIKDFDCRNAIFNGRVSFESAEFLGSNRFDGATFEGDVNLGFATFGNLSCDTAHFKSQVELSSVTIQFSSSFLDSKFEKDVEVWRAKFGFGGPRVVGDLLLSESEPEIGVELAGEKGDHSVVLSSDREETDSGHTSFDQVEFKASLIFRETHFFNPVSFDGAVLNKRTVFYGEKSSMFWEGCDFRGVRLPKDEELVFDKVYLGKTSFHDTNLEKVTFRDVNWGEVKDRKSKLLRGGTFILWDERRPSDGMDDWVDDSKTAENYRQLVLNFEGRRDFETAEYFHIGEMEMRRRKFGDRHGYEDADFSPSWLYEFVHERTKLWKIKASWHDLRKYANFYGLYWVSSRYGTSFGQAFVVLIGMIFLTSYLFMLAGFQGNKESSDTSWPVIEYNLFPSATHQVGSASKMFSDFREALSFTLSIVTFQKDRFYQPISWHSKYVLYFAVLILTAQSAMVLLAIRRRFKR